MYKIIEVISATVSVIGKAIHTPISLKNFDKIKAGIMMNKYLIKEITKDGHPFDKASKTPLIKYGKVEIINPLEIILKAIAPLSMVVSFLVNKDIN